MMAQDRPRNGGHSMDAEDDDTEVVKDVAMPALQWEDAKFQRQTMKALNKMRKNKQFCDVTLRIGKQDIMAHRVVLAAASPYFVELFTSDRSGPSQKEVEGGGIIYEMDGGFSKDSLERLIDYAYTSVLNVPGELLKPVYLAASALRLDRAANECARFMASNMDLTSGLEIRSTQGVASSASSNVLAQQAASEPNNGTGNGTSSKNSVHSDEDGDDADSNVPDDGLSQRHGFNLVGKVDDLIASANLEQLQNNREFLALPRFCVEVLHVSKEERDAAQARPLCELVLDWAHRKWQDDDSVDIEECFLLKSSLLIMSKDHSLKDCKDVEEGSAHDSDIIQDYKKKSNTDKPKTRKVNRRTPAVKPAKPREMLYTRYINQEEAARSENSEQYCWKVIVAHRLDNKSILGVVSLDAKLMILSIVQRVNIPASPSMTRSCSEGSLTAGLRSPGGNANSGSRPPSLDKDVFVPVALMKYAKCATGAVGFQGKLVVCGGYDRGECLNKVEAYDIATNSWEKWPSMLCKRGRFDVTVVDDNVIYAVGGSNGHSEEKSVEIYSPEKGKWIFGPSLPVPLSNIGLAYLDGAIYCVGGSYGSTGSKYCFKLDIAAGAWERIADLHIGRFQAAVIAFEGRIWAVGGCESWNPLNSLEIYDPSSDTWCMGPPLNTPRRGCGLAIRKGQLIVVGGTDGTQSMCTTEVLDMEENAWHPGPTMTFCRANVNVASVNDRLWAVGGFTGKNFLNSVEFLDPATNEWTTYLPIENKDATEQEPNQEVVGQGPEATEAPKEQNTNDQGEETAVEAVSEQDPDQGEERPAEVPTEQDPDQGEERSAEVPTEQDPDQGEEPASEAVPNAGCDECKEETGELQQPGEESHDDIAA